MKKTMIIILGLLLTFSIAFAQENVEKEPRGGIEPTVVASEGTSKEGTPEPKAVASAGTPKEGNKTGEGPVMTMNGTQVHAGLSNALSNVKNENAKESLTRNMNRFMEKYQEKLQNYKNVSVEVDEETQKMTVKAKKEVKYFGFIKGSATDKIQIEKNGEIKEKKPWYRFMYKEMNTEGQSEE